MAEFERMDPDQYRDMKKQEREEVFEMLSSSTQSLMDKNEMISYLDMQAALFDQTVSNVLLIKAQRPDATWIRTGDDWKEDNIFPVKGQKAIMTLTSRSYRRDDGSMGTVYDVAKVFDISQTTAAERNIFTHKYRDVLDSIMNSSISKIEMTNDVPGGMDAFYDRDKDVVFVKEDLGKDEKFLAVARELSCSELMRMDAEKTRDEVLPYGECAAYILAKKYGIEAHEPDADKMIDRFVGKEEKQVRKELSDMKQSASIIDARVKEHQKTVRENKESER